MWTCDGKRFEDFDAMEEYARGNLSYVDPDDVESWVDDNYDASEIFRRCKHEQYAETVVIDIEDEYLDAMIDEARDEFDEGKDIQILDSLFEWED